MRYRLLVVEEHEISRHASIGIGRELVGDPALLKSFATALDEYTRKEYSSAASFRRMSIFDERQDRALRARQKLKTGVSRAVAKRRVDLQPLLANDYFKSPSRFIIRELADMFCLCSTDPDAKAFFARLVEQLCQTWKAERSGRRRQDGEREGFDYETETFVADAISLFALGLTEADAVALFAPFRDVAQAHPEGIAKLLHRLTLKECDRHRPDVFWALWSPLADGLIQWVNGQLRAQRRTMKEVAEAIFLGLDWYETTTNWRSMTGHDQLLVQAFARLQPCDEIVEQFAAHLTTIGRGLLPSVMPVLATKLTEPGVRITDLAMFRLEKALANVVHSGAPQVRQDPALRHATLVVLGRMVDAGSSRAYRMRDDFLTPLRAHAAA